MRGEDLTTFRIGGPIATLVDAATSSDIEAVVRWAREEDRPLAVLGGGSNTLLCDAGFPGVLLRPRNKGIALVAPGVVRAETGLTFNGFVRWCLGHGFAGYEAWAGTPGAIGGAIHGNAHFRSRPFSDRVIRVRVLDRTGGTHDVPKDAMTFAYDTSRLQRTREIAISVDVAVDPGDPEALRRRAKESLAYRKGTQPLGRPSAGCVFRNPEDQKDRLPPGVPCSAGALVDRVGLKGFAIGGARVSPVHANFIVNEGGARASDVVALMEEARRRVFDAYGIALRDEIVRLGEFA